MRPREAPPTIKTLFGQNLRHCRDRADLSQEELSVLASLHRTEISQLERGLRMPQLDTLVKLAGGLEVAPEAFFEGIVWRPGRYAPGAFEVPDGEKGTA